MKLFAILCLYVTSIYAVPFIKRPSAIRVTSDVRINGGDVAKDGQFPYQVAIYFDTSEYSYFCGGALVAKNWVLTAGQCVDKATVFTLHLGSNNLVTVDPNRVTVGASHYEVHPDYNPITLENDIGLIRIDVDYTTNDAIAIIPLGTSQVGGGVNVTVSGWGSSGDWDGVTPDLNFLNEETLTNDNCKAIFGDAVTDGMICAAGRDTKGVCSGDSGDPLVVDDVEGNAVLVGLTSWISTRGCQSGDPSGYTRTAYYADWVQSVIGA